MSPVVLKIVVLNACNDLFGTSRISGEEWMIGRGEYE
jgi:hypothetical protein